MDTPQYRRLHLIAIAALTVCAVALCWEGVSWALRPGLFLFGDEIGNLTWTTHTTYRAILHLLPQQIYNDRPTGEALERFLYECFGFDYRRQLACFLAIHFANCAWVFLLFRRLGVSLPISLAAVGLFGSLSTTATTATYLGASFDVLCTFFVLGSVLAALGSRWWHWCLSAMLFFLALRSKEFAIVLPIVLTLLLGRRALLRLWPHYFILLVIGIRYLTFVPHMKASTPAQHPYYMNASPGTIIGSLAHYTALVFTWEGMLPVIGLALLTAYAVVRRERRILFAIAAYVLLLLPVCMLPNIRQPLYVYGPQIFLILAVCLFLDSLPAPALLTAVVIVACAVSIRTSSYFRDRIGWFGNTRSLCLRTAGEANAQLSGIGAGAHLYFDSGTETPWLMTAGPCDYLKLMRHDLTLSCVIQKPANELRELYDRDTAEKYLVEYGKDGSLRILLSAGPDSHTTSDWRSPNRYK